MASQEAKQAITPNINSIVHETQDALRAVLPEKKEQLFLDLSESEVWQEVKRYLTNKKETVMRLATESAQQSSDLQEIGLRFLMANLVVGMLDDLESEIESPRVAKILGGKSE